MFLSGRRGYTRGGEQRAEGSFLVLFNQGRELRALVRSTKLRQLGHFMMGDIQVGPHRICLSGTYGGDGLPKAPPPGVWEALEDNVLPPELAEKFWKGGGHNSAGSEGPDIHAWASERIVSLRRLRKVDWVAAQQAELWDQAVNRFKGARYYTPSSVQKFIAGDRTGDAQMLGVILLETFMLMVKACAFRGDE